MDELFALNSLMALVTLAALEIVLGVDNVVFIAIVTGRLPRDRQAAARRLGLGLAAAGRIALLFAISWLITLDKTELLTVMGFTFTGKDLILALGGLFLLAKATWEIHHNLEGAASPGHAAPAAATFGVVIAQILALDLVFSIDSVLTAVGMVKPDDYSAFWVPLTIMSSAILLSIAIMLAFVNPISRFIERHPTLKMLALSFLLLIGLMLVVEAMHQHIPRGYIYFAMGFSLFVELLNLKFAKKTTPAAQS